jgi:hypothetical protein
MRLVPRALAHLDTCFCSFSSKAESLDSDPSHAGSRPSTIFLTDFGCNEIVFFSGVSLVTFFAPAKKVTRSPQASESFGFLRYEIKGKELDSRVRGNDKQESWIPASAGMTN